MAKTQVLLKIIVNLKGFFIGIYNFSLFFWFPLFTSLWSVRRGLVWFRGNTGERFRLETTFNGIKEYFHGYVQHWGVAGFEDERIETENEIMNIDHENRMTEED